MSKYNVTQTLDPVTIPTTEKTSFYHTNNNIIMNVKMICPCRAQQQNDGLPLLYSPQHLAARRAIQTDLL